MCYRTARQDEKLKEYQTFSSKRLTVHLREGEGLRVESNVKTSQMTPDHLNMVLLTWKRLIFLKFQSHAC